MRATFKPEFLNRLDDVVVFDALGTEELARIVDLQVDRAARSGWPTGGSTLEVTAGGPRLAGADRATTRSYGARPLRRLVQSAIGDRLAKALLAGEVRDGDTVLVDLDETSDTLEIGPVRA